MTKGSMSNIMTEGNGFNEIEIKPKSPSDIARYAANKLLMQAASRNVVMGTKRKYLRFSVQSIVCRRMQDFLGIAHKSRPERTVCIARHITTYYSLLPTRKRAQRT